MLLNDEPIFITGFQRSGTSAVAYGLHNHFPGITNESNIVKSTALKYREDIKTHVKQTLESRYGINIGDSLDTFDVPGLDEFRKEMIKYIHYLINYLTIGSRQFFQDGENQKTSVLIYDAQYTCDASVWGDKLTNSASLIPALMKMFPKAKLIYVVRDGHGAVGSSLRLKWGKEEELWRRWVEELENYYKWADKIPHFLVRQEELLNGRNRVTENLSKFLGRDLDVLLMSGFIHKASNNEPPEVKETDWTDYLTNVPPGAVEMLKKLEYVL